MPMYERKCRVCKNRFIVLDRESHPCPMCEVADTVRVFSFNPLTSFQPHYSTALGKYVNTRQEFLDGLTEASVSASERTGIEHNFVPIDWQDQQGFGANDEGMDSYHATEHEYVNLDQ